MLELGEVVNLAEKAFAGCGVLDVEAEGLDRDGAVVLEVAGKVHAGHRAVAEGALRRVASD